jgi:hypothetical protein
MRTHTKLAALSLALSLGACSKPREQTAVLSDDLKRDLAEASTSATSGLTTTPQSYQRMRFVSSIEQSHATVRVKRPKPSRHPVQLTSSRHPLGEEVAQAKADAMPSMATESPAPEATTEAAPAAPTVVVAPRPSPEPTTTTDGSTPDGHVGGGNSGGGGLGGLLGGIIGAVVIRGGHGGVDKCDPRTEGRPTIIDQPVFGMPLPTGGSVFGGARRR